MTGACAVDGRTLMSWYAPSFVYQIYPLGLCGAPHENERLLTVTGRIYS